MSEVTTSEVPVLYNKNTSRFKYDYLYHFQLKRNVEQNYLGDVSTTRHSLVDIWVEELEADPLVGFRQL